ncbi:putative nuclease HARBI1 [Prorops nasuta]|uniref:putative nuclease HARBI1 n=1 Tax=Prorops nasuta TaxID=863751 RepID=UPI0034CD1737
MSENLHNIILNELLDEDSDVNEDEEIFEPIVQQSVQFNERQQAAGKTIIQEAGHSSCNENILIRFRKHNKEYDQHFFNQNIPRYSDRQFFYNFRMDKETYSILETLLRSHVVGVPINILRKRILLTLWLLATPESFRSVSDRFGLCISSCHFSFKQIVWALRNLMFKFIRWPTPVECEENERVFQRRCAGFEGIIGAIDGCHIPIKQPPNNANDYYNRKDFHSIILQGTCDYNGKFIHCLIGRPGRAHDAAVFKSSQIYYKLINAENPLLPPMQHILGDSAYPLLLNVMTPFKDNGTLTAQQINYNTKHASLRSIIERAFCLLKGKWRRLKYLDVNSVHMANHIIAAACTLHNFLLINKQAQISEIENRNNENDSAYDTNGIADNEDQLQNEDARTKRSAIMNYLL